MARLVCATYTRRGLSLYAGRLIVPTRTDDMTSAPRSHCARLLRVLAVALVCLFFAGGITHAYDEWEQVPNDSSQGDAGVPTRHASLPSGSTFFACGERAQRSDQQMKFFVSNIDQLWGTRIRVYQSLAFRSPHARPGGCVFYNPAFMRALFRGLMIPSGNTRLTDSILEAIMAHEIGHEVHDDFGPGRAGVAGETKELEADRFAGYTLERLDIPLDSITPYYGLAGDEFTGSESSPQARHGDSGQRIAALKHGWDLARWRLPEDYVAPTEGDQLSNSGAQ